MATKKAQKNRIPHTNVITSCPVSSTWVVVADDVLSLVFGPVCPPVLLESELPPFPDTMFSPGFLKKTGLVRL